MALPGQQSRHRGRRRRGSTRRRALIFVLAGAMALLVISIIFIAFLLESGNPVGSVLPE